MTTHQSESHSLEGFKDMLRNLDEKIEEQVQKTIDEVEKEYQAEQKEIETSNSKLKI